jgi:hypothetical protein
MNEVVSLTCQRNGGGLREVVKGIQLHLPVLSIGSANLASPYSAYNSLVESAPFYRGDYWKRN